jgi:hypothetical protein
MALKAKDNECFIPKEALSLSNFASKDNSRPVLTGLHIANGLAETADGFTTASYKISQGKDFPECCIPMNDILRAGINKKWQGIKISIEKELYIIKGEFNLITSPMTPISSPVFPSTKGLYNDLKTKNTAAYVGLSTFVLKKLVAATEKSGHKMVVLRIREVDKTKRDYLEYGTPIEFCTFPTNSSESIIKKDSGKLTGLLMPCSILPDACNWATNKEIE